MIHYSEIQYKNHTIKVWQIPKIAGLMTLLIVEYPDSTAEKKLFMQQKHLLILLINADRFQPEK